MPALLPRYIANLAGLALAAQLIPAYAQGGSQDASSGPQPTYADIADLADSAAMVVHAQVRKVARVDDARVNGLAPGKGRFYVTAQTQALLTGKAPIGESFSYLVDLPLDARGKAPKLKKQEVLLFARPVPGHPEMLQLVSPGAQQPWSAQAEVRLRTILQELVSPDAPARITGVRELLYVPGNLAGEGETQIFLTTEDRSAASITVQHHPGSPPAWGVSFSELVASTGRPPRPDTIEWYRLACFLPAQVPARANVSEGGEARRQAAMDYQMVLRDLGPCRRNLAGA